VKLGNQFFSIPKEIDPLQIDREEAIELIRQGKESKAKQVLHDFGEIQVLKGPYGPYIKYNKKNFKIPKNTDAESLDKATCEQIISEAPPPRPKRKTKAS
jgi:DNA topoisomerase-1